MSIRSRLLSWLVPAMIAFVALISLFFYYNWYNAIIKSFRSNLKSIVVSTAENLQSDEVDWMKQHARDPNYFQSPLYKKYSELFKRINTDLPIANLYMVTIENVKKGEPVLLDQPKSEQNPTYTGENPEAAYREVYILDPLDQDAVPQITYDFTDQNEQILYQTKQSMVTPIYQGTKSDGRFMTGYAPILNKDGNVSALVAADLNLDIFDQVHRNAVILIFLSAAGTILMVIGAIYWIANKISKPVQQLNSSALTLAAGDYEEDIHVKGPKEISELSNTLNTLRECLLENNTRLRDASLARERLYGEYECAQLLQNRMLEYVLQEFKDPKLLIRKISFSASSSPQGVLLDILNSSDAKTSMTLRESSQEGFEGTYQLLRDDKGNSLRFELDRQNGTLTFFNHDMPAPFVWSTQQGKMSPENGNTFKIESGDYFVIMTTGLSKVLNHPKLLREWFAKVFRHFSKEGPDLLSAMLTSELNFLTKKQHASSDIHILCFHYKA